LQKFLDRKSADCFGLMDGEFGGESGFFYRGGRGLAAAVAWAVRLGDDGEDFKVRLREEVLEDGDSELGRAAKE
jgi:hypothetical protein